MKASIGSLLEIGGETDERSAIAGFCGCGSVGDVSGTAEAEELVEGCFLMGLLPWVEAASLFGALRLGPLARALVMWVNSAEFSCVVCRESCGLPRACIGSSSFADWSLVGLGLPLRDKIPARAGLRRAASLLFSGSFVLKVGSAEDATSAGGASGFC
jgi:hypothetical protein